ncbi:MAG: hypothetical protein ACYC63_12940 [Armatimonadota bacterium]
MHTTGHAIFDGLAKTQVGVALWAFLKEPNNVIRLVTAVDLGLPAVYGVEKELERSFPYAENLKGHDNDKFRRLAGFMVKHVLAEARTQYAPNGYKPLKPARRKSTIFQGGHLYELA